MSGVTKMAWDVMSGVTKTAWDVLSGVANLCGMFCPGCKKMAWDVLSRDVLSGSQLQLVVCYLATSVYCKLQELRSEFSQGSGLITIYIICFHNTILYHARIQRGTGVLTPSPPPKITKLLGSLDSLENYNAT